MSDLPVAVRQQVASFLGTGDALIYASASKQIEQDIGLSVLTVLNQTQPKHWYGEQDGNEGRPRMYMQLPIICTLQGRTQSVVFSCRWVDQGWGNRKGKLYIVEEGTVEDTTRPFKGGKVVAESPIAEHHVKNLRLFFSPKSKQKYSLWFQVGGGGGHELYLENIRVDQVIYGDVEGAIAKNFKILNNHNVLPPASSFVPQMLKAAAKSLLSQMRENREHDPHLSSVLEEYGIDVTRASLEGLDLLASSAHEMGRAFETNVEDDDDGRWNHRLSDDPFFIVDDMDYEDEHDTTSIRLSISSIEEID